MGSHAEMAAVLDPDHGDAGAAGNLDGLFHGAAGDNKPQPVVAIDQGRGIGDMIDRDVWMGLGDAGFKPAAIHADAGHAVGPNPAGVGGDQDIGAMTGIHTVQSVMNEYVGYECMQGIAGEPLRALFLCRTARTVTFGMGQICSSEPGLAVPGLLVFFTGGLRCQGLFCIFITRKTFCKVLMTGPDVHPG